jgi:SAM-dependent methyltransferase
MSEPDLVARALAGVRDLYTSGLVEHGVASKAVGWKDEASQLLRFEQLAKLVEPADEPFTVADWGCGYGAMFSFLAERFPDRLVAYRGCDISVEMVEAASAAIDDPRAEFVVGDDAGAADYTFVSGTFNVRFEAPDDSWEEYIRTNLRRLASQSRRGLAFNLLSTYVDWQEPHLFYGDPRAFFDFCKRELSPRVALLHDYPLYEWTIVVLR